MGCSSSGHKAFLIGSNVVLLFIGVSILILGIKMKELLQAVLLIEVPIIASAVEAVVATGWFISVAGVTGISGACYETLWIILAYLASMGIIVIMEFGLGVTLLFVKKAIENYVKTDDCNSSCATAMDAVVLDYALPSAGLMMTIIIAEAFMIYSAVRLYFYFRDASKYSTPVQQYIIDSFQMQDVASPLPTYAMSPHTPRVGTPHLSYLHHPTPGFLQPSPQYASPMPPPLYSTLSPEMQEPPSYLEVQRHFPKMESSPAAMNPV